MPTQLAQLSAKIIMAFCNNMKFSNSFKAGKLTASGLTFVILTGCVSTSWLARQIVHPNRQSTVDAFSRTLAAPFYSRNFSLSVPSPDAGTIDAAIIEPAHYDPEIRVSYKKIHSNVLFNINFPKLPVPPNTLGFKRMAKRHPVKTYAWRLRKWLATMKPEKPVGTIVMLPPFGMGKASLLSWALLFADRGWRVVLVDLRGQGVSHSPYLTWGIRDREDLHRLAVLLKARHILIRPWIYFGVSYGAGVALMAAVRNPAPNGVIAVAPWATASKVIPRFAHSAASWLAPRIASPKWQIAEKKAGHLAGINFQEARPKNAVTFIHVPVLYLGGGSDHVTPAKSIRAMARKTPEATVVIKPGLTHVVVVADVPGFCGSIFRWLNARIFERPLFRKCLVEQKDKNGRIEARYIAPNQPHKPLAVDFQVLRRSLRGNSRTQVFQANAASMTYLDLLICSDKGGKGQVCEGG